MKSWKAWYGLYAVMVALGCLGALGLGSGGLQDTWNIKRALVSKGQHTDGTVTQMRSFPMNEDTGYNMFYTYSVGGQKLEGVAETTATEYFKYHTGDSIGVVYLPDDPATSDYRPADWIEMEQGTGKISSDLIAVGLILLVVTGIFDFRRRANTTGASTGSTDPDAERVYFAISAVSVIGAVFLLGGLFFQVAIVRQIFSGQTTIVTFNNTPQVAGFPMKMLMAMFPVPFWCIGSYLVLTARNFRLTITPTGIKVRTALGKYWEANWTSLKIVAQRDGGIQISDSTHKVWVQNYIQNSSELLAGIRARLE